MPLPHSTTIFYLFEFNNHEKRLYDVKPLLTREHFAPLSNPAFFKNVAVDSSGYGIIWNHEIDLSEYELWTKGITVDECG